ncbi:hypothetical protein D3C87_64790 [compost metagenome]
MKLINQIPGSKYAESGKIDFARFFLFLILGYVLSGLAGVGYGLLSDLNPWIYLNFILLGIAVLVVAFSASLFKMAGKLRNRYVAMILAIFFGFVCIYNAWSAIYAVGDQSVFGGMYFQHSISELTQQVSSRVLSIGKFGRNGAGLGTTLTSLIYVIEFLVILVIPAWYLVKNPTYYCEDCDKPMNETEFYFGVPAEELKTIESGVKSGKLKELFTLTAYPEKKLDLKLKYIHCTSNECPECSTIVYSADLGIAKVEKEDTSFKKEESLMKNVFGSKN